MLMDCIRMIACVYEMNTEFSFLKNDDEAISIFPSGF